MSNTWDAYDNFIRQCVKSVKQALDDGRITQEEYDKYIEETKSCQKEVKGDDYDEHKDNACIGY